MSVGEKISEQHLKALAKRAGKVAAIIELATRSSTNADVRREGARFGEVIQEWLEDIKELVATDDAAAEERAASFRARLRHAEDKIERWQLPPIIEEQIKLIERGETKRKRKAA